MNEFRYMLGEARQGIRRNLSAALAAVLIVFISLSITGAGLLVKSGLDEALGYLQSQVKIKLFVAPEADMAGLVGKLRDSGQFTAIEPETGTQMLDQMKQFFVGREYLFAAFQAGEIPSAVTLEVSSGQDMDKVAVSLAAMPGVIDVIYPQQFARTVLSWSRTIDWYGSAMIAILLMASFLTVCVAISLALHQRTKDIRIKLLLGAKESHVRAQFLFEGVLLGLVGGILATFVVQSIHVFGLKALQRRFPLVFEFSTGQLALTMGAIVLLGAAMGFAGSYFTTRRLIDNG